MACLWSREPSPRRRGAKCDRAQPRRRAPRRPRRATGAAEARASRPTSRPASESVVRSTAGSAVEPRAEAQRSPLRHRREVESAAEDATRTRRPRERRESKRRTRGRETTTRKTPQKKITQVLDIHGRQKQQKRTSTFFEFCRATSGVLLCTDVAARGLDIPEVNWIVQFDPPDDPREYVHRVGRTARGETGTGRALLFLAPAELGFLRWLRDARVALHEYEFDMSKVTNIQSALTKLVEKNYYLHRAARDAYRSYLLAYASHAHKDIFDVHSLDLQAVSESFGFAVPPRVDLNLSHRGDKKTRRNPKKGDRRQPPGVRTSRAVASSKSAERRAVSPIGWSASTTPRPAAS